MIKENIKNIILKWVRRMSEKGRLNSMCETPGIVY